MDQLTMVSMNRWSLQYVEVQQYWFNGSWTNPSGLCRQVVFKTVDQIFILKEEPCLLYSNCFSFTSVHTVKGPFT